MGNNILFDTNSAIKQGIIFYYPQQENKALICLKVHPWGAGAYPSAHSAGQKAQKHPVQVASPSQCAPNEMAVAIKPCLSILYFFYFELLSTLFQNIILNMLNVLNNKKGSVDIVHSSSLHRRRSGSHITPRQHLPNHKLYRTLFSHSKHSDS